MTSQSGKKKGEQQPANEKTFFNAEKKAVQEHQFSSPRRPVEEEDILLKLPPDLDRLLHAWVAKYTLGLSPASILLAYADWFMHLSAYPVKQQELILKAHRQLTTYLKYIQEHLIDETCQPCIEPREHDNRFERSGWNDPPFNFLAQGFLLAEEWWQQATNNIHGVSSHHSEIVDFVTRQILDMISPSNFLLTNPEVMKKTIDENGHNLVRGFHNLLDDFSRFLQNKLPRGTEKFKVGKDIATSKGQVIYRNELFELIQYEPKTKTVFAEPVLMIPAWIMKFYILDLSPNNSMVDYLLEKGHTVFMISWKNPDKKDANYGLSDYLRDGALNAINVVSEVIPNEKIHAVGYCIGGTILSIIAAYLAKKKINKLKTLTFFATQFDFEDAGELLMFIDDSELAILEDLMWEQGYLKKWQVSGSFNMLRSKDLIWSRIVRDYLKGEEKNMFDLMAWNADATRLPYKLHSEYLRSLYLNNDLAEHRFKFENTLINLEAIKTPVFAVSTLEDHIAPWKSAFKLHQFLETDLTFVLTNGGHNAGIISEPGHKGRVFQIKNLSTKECYISPDEWLEQATKHKGSWWVTWEKWLRDHSNKKVKARPIGNEKKGYKPLTPAPGKYVYKQ